MIVKVPLTRDGIRACKALSGEGIAVNVTLCFSPAQALLAAKAGASFVSPFVGRLDDIATNGMELIREIVEIYDNYDFKTEILVASCRHPIHVVEAARMGADIATCPPAVIDQLFNHPLTNIGLEKFLKDWEKAQRSEEHTSELQSLAYLVCRLLLEKKKKKKKQTYYIKQVI